MVIQELQPRTHSQQAYTCIRQKIISLQLPPGSVINEAALQKELQLGRTPIREALKQLSLEKLVTILPRRGMFVTDIKITDLQRLFEVRIVLESLAVQLAMQHGTEAQWQEMQQVLDDLPAESITAVSKNEQLISIDEKCHQLIYAATHNEFLQDTLTTMYALSLRLWYFFLAKIGDMEGAVMEHQHILDALQSNNTEEAVRLMEGHIHTFQEEIQAVMF